MPNLDPNLIMAGAGQNVPLNDMASLYDRALNFRSQRQAYDQATEAGRQRQVMNEAYQSATGPDGVVDNGKLQSYMAQNMAGGQIPAAQKANLENLKTRAEMQDKEATRGKTIQETLYTGLKLTNDSLASLASNPQTTDKDVYGEMGRLVNAGAFNVQAQHVGVTPDAYAKNLLATMPTGDPQALRGWLVQQGMKVMDASKRLETSIPKYDEQDQGGAINQGTIDPMTGQRTAGVNIQKTVTPGEAMSDATTRRGQNMTDSRVRESQSFTMGQGTAGLTEAQNVALSEAINSGRLDPNRVNSRTAGLLADLAIRNPKTDFNKLGADSALMKNAAYQQKTMVASTLPEIMGNMVDAGKKLNFSDMKFVGQAQGWLKGQVNDPDLTEYMTQRNDALMSIAGVMRGVGMTDMAHKAETEVANPTMSPTAMDAWLRGQMKSLEPRLRNNARIMHTPPPASTTPVAGTNGRPSLDSFFKH